MSPVSTASANPFNQSFTILLPDGKPLKVSMAELNFYAQYGIRICINYGSQIGASLMLLIVLLLLTRKEKRASLIFWLNTLALAFNTIRSILQCLYFTGPWYNAYAYLADDYSQVQPVDYGVSIASDVFTLVVLALLECSLVMQTRAVSVMMRPWHRWIVLASAALVALTAIALRLLVNVTNSIAIMHAADYQAQEWIPTASNYTNAASICIFSIFFVVRLTMTLHERKKMGLSHFGPMQVIFIMGCQSLVIPAVFAVLESSNAVPEFGSQTLTLLAIFLPLSSMWASAASNTHYSSQKPTNSSSSSTPRFLGSLFLSSSDPITEKKLSSTLSDEQTASTVTTVSHARQLSKVFMDQIDRDLEALGQRVQVTSTYEVNH